MTPAEVTSIIRRRTKTTTTTLPDDDLKVYLNSFKDLLCEEIALRSPKNILGFVNTFDLVADQREYPLPRSATTGDAVTTIQRVEANLKASDAADDNWVVLFPNDIDNINSGTSEEQILARFSNYQARTPGDGGAHYDILRTSIFLYTGQIYDVTDGLKVWTGTYTPDITDLTSTQDMSVPESATVEGFPKQLHWCLVNLCIMAIKDEGDKPLAPREYLVRLDSEISAAIQRLTGKYQTEPSFIENDDVDAEYNNGHL